MILRYKAPRLISSHYRHAEWQYADGQVANMNRLSARPTCRSATRVSITLPTRARCTLEARGKIAGYARKQLKTKRGRPVVSKKIFLDLLLATKHRVVTTQKKPVTQRKTHS
jgi:hypothetical protein